VYRGYWVEKVLSTGIDQGIGGKKTRKEALVRRILKADCLDDWKVMAKKFMQSNVKDKYFDRKIILEIFAHEDGQDDWR
jgi:hypothetical protein